jgi:ABC-type xylose transport system permease subunit
MAKYKGLPNVLVFLVFVNMGVLSALAGLVFTARLNSATVQVSTLDI